MKKTNASLIRTAILIIMIQSFTRDYQVYASVNPAGEVYRVSGNSTALEVKVLAPSCSGLNNGVADLTI